MSSKVINNSKLVMFYVQDLNKEKQLNNLCRQLGFECRKLKISEINTEVGTLAGLHAKGTGSEKMDAPMGYKLPEIIIFSGISSDELDKFLAEYKKKGIEPVGLKAILTPHNISWSVYELVQELQRERIAMLLGRRK